LYQTLAKPLQVDGLADNGIQMLNSGVIGLSSNDAGFMDKLVRLMDSYHAKSPKTYTLEEFMLAVAARQQGMRLAECTDVIHHYWSRK
jgi:hypothetical protein